MFKVSLASLQTCIDTPNCVLEDRFQYSTVHIPNVFCDGHLQITNCVYCNRQVHRDFLITLYILSMYGTWNIQNTGVTSLTNQAFLYFVVVCKEMGLELRNGLSWLRIEFSIRVFASVRNRELLGYNYGVQFCSMEF